MPKNTEQLKKKLEEEKSLLEKELEELGRRSLGNPEDWEALPPETKSEADPDKNIAADMVESFEEAVSVQGELEQRFFEVKKALERIEGETYGICRVCNKEIEEGRLSANPAATTCIAHLNF